MPFGKVLGLGKKEIQLTTADNKKVVINSNIQRIGLKTIGLPHTEVRQRARLIYGNLKIKEGMDVLDAGSGPGMYALSIASEYPARVLGVDIDTQKLKSAEEIAKNVGLKNVKFGFGDLRNLKNIKNNSFDVVICSDVLEHVDKDEAAMKEIYRILKPGAYALITFPHWNEHNARTMKEYGHERPGYKFEDVRRKFGKAGFKIEKIRGYTYLFGKIAWYINSKSFFSPILTAALFPIAYFISLLDFIAIGSPNGVFAVVRKAKK